MGKSDTESFSNIDVSRYFLLSLTPGEFHVSKLQDQNLLLSRDADGASPLLLAAKMGNSSIVNIILSKVPQAIKTTDKVNHKVKIPRL